MVIRGLLTILTLLSALAAGAVFAAPPEQAAPPTSGWTLTINQSPSQPVYGETTSIYAGFSRNQVLSRGTCVRLVAAANSTNARNTLISSYGNGGFLTGAWTFVPPYSTINVGVTDVANRLAVNNVYWTPAYRTIYWTLYLQIQNASSGACAIRLGPIVSNDSGDQVRTERTSWRVFAQTDADFTIAGSPLNQRAGFASQVVVTATNSGASGNYCYWAEFTDVGTGLNLGYGMNSRTVRIVAGQNSSFTLANLVESTSTSRTFRAQVRRAFYPTTQVTCPLAAIAAVANPRPISLGTKEVTLNWIYDTPTASDELTLTYTPLNPDLTQTVTFSAVVANSATGAGIKHCYYVDVRDPNLVSDTTAGIVIASGGSHTFTITADPPGNALTKEFRFQAIRLNSVVDTRLNAGDRCPKSQQQGSDQTGVKSVNVSWRNPGAAAFLDDNECPPCFGASSALYIDGSPDFTLNEGGGYTIRITWQPLQLPSLVDWDGIVSVGYGYAVTGGKDEDNDGLEDNQPFAVNLNPRFGVLTFDYNGDYTYNNGRRDFLVWARAQVDPSGDGYPAKRHQADFEFVPAGSYIYTSPSRRSFTLPAHTQVDAEAAEDNEATAVVDRTTVPARIAERENVDPRFVGAGYQAAMDAGRIITDLMGGYEENPALNAAENNAAYLSQVEVTARVGYIVLMLGLSVGVSAAGSKGRGQRILSPLAAGIFTLMVIPGGLLGWLWLGLYGWQPIAGILVILAMIVLVIIIGRFRSGL